MRYAIETNDNKIRCEDCYVLAILTGRDIDRLNCRMEKDIQEGG
jgi:hypothetical protein